MTWSKKVYQEQVQQIEKQMKKEGRNPYQKNEDRLNVKALYEYAREHGMDITDVPEEVVAKFTKKVSNS